MYTVADLMSREVVTLEEEDDLSLADTFLKLGRIRHLPVVRNGRLVGLVTHRDILRACARPDPGQVRAREVMTRALKTALPATPLGQAARTMLKYKLGCLPVVDADGALVGILTEADLVRFAADLIGELDEGLEGLETVQQALGPR